jgi:hypothetical protein
MAKPGNDRSGHCAAAPAVAGPHDNPPWRGLILLIEHDPESGNRFSKNDHAQGRKLDFDPVRSDQI